ncbi:hypothetical protein [Actinoplanes flavus]|uniref:Uncharacterized protein n=1 Tax=Actinoplanes flavus TaxID=2820290 RepID=A0ABS3UG43_9ACTN|nr:hypothetical protein [Actinoplanes flavus]MBO3737723.1 hypothetical protein [Actinoplanes flavus]
MDNAPPRRPVVIRYRWQLAALVAVAVTSTTTLFVLTGSKRPVTTAATPACSTVPSPAVSAQVPVLPVSHWEKRFLETWAFERTEALPASRTGDSWRHYDLSYSVDANTAMFRATGNRRYLDRALEYITGVTATAKPSKDLPTCQYRDNCLGWVSMREDLQPTGVEVPLYESYFWRHATTTLRVMRQTPRVYDDPGYRKQYDTLLAFTEKNVFDKWHTRGANDNIYRSRTHRASHWAAITVNLAAVTEDPARYDPAVQQRLERHQVVNGQFASDRYDLTGSAICLTPSLSLCTPRAPESGGVPGRERHNLPAADLGGAAWSGGGPSRSELSASRDQVVRGSAQLAGPDRFLSLVEEIVRLLLDVTYRLAPFLDRLHRWCRRGSADHGGGTHPGINSGGEAEAAKSSGW